MISSTMNLVMTVLGFAMSATFVVFVCARLLCVRVQLRRRPRRPSDSAQHDQLERTLSGVEASVVASFPTIKYSQEVFASRDDALCTVCLGEYEEKEVLRVIPRCGHAFHVECIDAWLKLHSTCPICRVSVRGREDGGGISSPLISRSARPRYSPRAVPDHMFEEQQQAQWRSSDADLESGSEQPIPGRRKWGARLWRKGEEVCASSSSASACAVVAQPRVRDPFSFSLRLNAAFSEDEEGASSPDPVSASCKSHPAAIAS